MSDPALYTRLQETADRWCERAEKAEAEVERLREALDEAWYLLAPSGDYEPAPEEPGMRRIKSVMDELLHDKQQLQESR